MKRAALPYHNEMGSAKTCRRTCIECHKEFMARVSDVNRGKANFCSLSCVARHTNQSNYTAREIRCRMCGTMFPTTRTTTLYCSAKCKKNHYDRRRKGLNTKTITNRPCEICGWDEASRDAHHIIPLNRDGSNDLSNMVSLCPNCHRKTHAGLITQEELQNAVAKRHEPKANLKIQRIALEYQSSNLTPEMELGH